MTNGRLPTREGLVHEEAPLIRAMTVG